MAKKKHPRATAKRRDAAPASPAQAILERLQTDAYARAGFDLPALRKSWRQVQREVDRETSKEYGLQPSTLAAPDLPSPYENPTTYGTLMRLEQEIRAAALEFKHAIDIKTVLGTMPSGQVNAMAIWLPGSSEYLVLFEAGLFTFAMLMSKAIVQAFPLTKRENGWTSFSTIPAEVEAHLATNAVPAQRFQEAVLAYLLEANPGRAPRYLLPEVYIQPYWHLLHSMELFVMGHEYGHIIGKHFGDGASAHARSDHTQRPDSDALRDHAVIRRNYEKEFEADLKGGSLAIRAMQSHKADVALSFWGADLFFSCLDVVERGLGILRDGREPTMPRSLDEVTSRTHPPTILRREGLRMALAKNFPAEPEPAPIHLSRLVQQVVDRLWASTRERLLELRARGVAPHPMWLQEPLLEVGTPESGV